MKQNLRAFLVGVSLLGLSANTAAAREEGANAAALGVSDAVRSSAVGTTSIFFNPATLHQMLQYAIETGYQYNSPTDGHVFTASIADSATNDVLAMGVSYSYLSGRELTTDLDRVGHSFRAVAATGYRAQGFTAHAGVGVRYLSLTIDDGAEGSGVTMDAGALLTLAGMFRLAVVGHNLVETDLSETPRRLGLGTSILWNSLLVSFDAVLDFETLEDETQAEYGVGVEYAISGQVPIRVGYQNDRITLRQYISGGIGYVSRVAALDFGFRQNIEDKDENIFTLNVKIFVP